MLISPRKRHSSSAVGMVGSLTTIIGGAAAFLFLLQDYTQATMSEAPRQSVIASSYSDPDSYFFGAKNCLDPASKSVANAMQQTVFTQILASKAGDTDTAARCLTESTSTGCPAHIHKIMLSSLSLASATHFRLIRTRTSCDRDYGVIDAEAIYGHSAPLHAQYLMAFDNGVWKVQGIEINSAASYLGMHRACLASLRLNSIHNAEIAQSPHLF